MNHDARICPRCLDDLPCAAAARERAFWADEEYEMDKAAGLDRIRQAAYRRHASEPPRYVPMIRDRFGEYVELDEERC